MKRPLKLFLIVIIAAFLSTIVVSCAPSHVSVGVGVGVAGPYGGRYPGGTGVWVARPMYPPAYYPSLPRDIDRELVKGLDANPFGSTQNSIAEEQTPEFHGPFPVTAAPGE